MSASDTRLAAAFTGFIATLTGHPVEDLPRPEASGSDWRAVLRLWLGQLDCGLVSLANPSTFSWAGHWIGIVESPDQSADAVAVLLFGTPSAVIASPDAPALVGKSVDEMRFKEGIVLVPFQPFKQQPRQPQQLSGEVAGIYVAEVNTGPMTSVQVATTLAGKGL